MFFLAYHLHWSRESILGLAVVERRRFVELLQTQLKREQETVQGTSAT